MLKSSVFRLALCFSVSLLARTAMAQSSNATPTDPQIAALVATANEAEIKAAQMAKSKAQSPEVKEFAQHMIDEHTKNSRDLATKVGIKPMANEQVAAMKKQTESKTKELMGMKGAEFDKAYMDAQVNMHGQILSQLDSKLIPAAKNAQLKSFLETTKEHVQSHLDHAKQIQTAMNK